MTPNDRDLTAEQVRFMFNYNPATGDLTWRNPLSHNVHEGQRAGSIGAKGRRYISIDGAGHLAHRVAWLYVHGALPQDANITAVNGNYDDLRLTNLAVQSFSETAQKGSRSTNTSGMRGVSWDKAKNKWMASITRNYKQVMLGRFDTKEEAAVAYQKAARETLLTPVVDPEARRERATLLRRSTQLRRLWKKLVKGANGQLGWQSFQAFSEDVGEVTSTKLTLAPIDAKQPLGPDNWRWEAVQTRHDFATPEGKRAYDKERRARNPHIIKNEALLYSFGISLDDYQAMLTHQEGLCACCGGAETEMRAGKLRMLAVDHCHATGAIRGLLCGACNKGIGNFRDDPERLEKAAAYLRRHAKKAGAESNVIPMKRS